MTSNLYPGEFSVTLVKSGEGYWGGKLMNYLRQYPDFLVLGTEGECLAYDDNRVELSEEKDEFGVPRPKVTFNYGTNERSMRDDIHRLGTQILEAAGAEEVLVSEGNDHTMGGCRMGNDSAKSVVDANLKAHDHPNLYLCDASVFVTPGGAQPSQTIMALATRLSEHLTGQAGGALRARAKESGGVIRGPSRSPVGFSRSPGSPPAYGCLDWRLHDRYGRCSTGMDRD